MKRVLGIILGGGAGSRLYPLTKLRAKPAVSLAGKYRLIDIPVSNCINSELYKIYVLTQFNSTSLNRHLNHAYKFSCFTEGFVEVLAAQKTKENPEWFQGTADAVRQYIELFDAWDVDEYLILSGDHLYRMDYRLFIERHRQTNADITLSVLPIDEKRAPAFGLMKIDKQGKIIDFSEKPTGNALKQMQVDTTALGLSSSQAYRLPYIASMGIYVFKKEVMKELLSANPDSTDFGHEIIPPSISRYNVQAHLFQDYWQDIGTIEAFYEANLTLTRQPHPPFSFYDEKAPIYTRARYLPPNKLVNCQITESMLGEGCILHDCRIHHSVIGIRTVIQSNCTIEDTIVMGSDYYESDPERESCLTTGIVPIGIGCNATIRRAIIDKNARIGANVLIINKDRIEEAQREEKGFYIRNGIVVVLKNAIIPESTVI